MNHDPRHRPAAISLRLAFLAAAAALLALALPAAATALPSERAYEMVSPLDKNGGDVGAGFTFGQYQASLDGDRLAYQALGGFDAPSSSLVGSYVARRGERSWASNPTNLPVLPVALIGGSYGVGLSADGTHGIAGTNMDLETGEVSPNGDSGALYMLDVDTGETQPFVPPLDVNGDPISIFGPNSGQIRGNSDFSRVFFFSTKAFTADALNVPTGAYRVYLWDNGSISLASRNPADGTAAGGSFPSPAVSNGQVPNIASADGKVLYWMSASGLADLRRSDYHGAQPVIETIAGSATFGGASSDGNIVFFSTNQALVDADTDTQVDVYQYDHSKPEGQRYTLVSADSEPADTASGVTRIHNVSSDGSAVVFATNDQLVAGEPTDAGRKLYLWQDGELHYIANTGAGTAGEVPGNAVSINGDGSLLAFLTTAQLTAEDNGGFAQIYAYEPASETLSCASCRADGEPSGSAAQFASPPQNQQSFHVADQITRNASDGGELFFQTEDSLLRRDTNGNFDVYVWSSERGLDLISSGRSIDDSYFADASPDGKNVFFVTREQLVGWDTDDRVDAYDARLGGGLPEPEEQAPPCAGDDCQEAPSDPPPFSDPGSADVDGPGNAAAARCAQAERRSARLESRADQLERRANRLERKAKRASGKRAKRINRRAKRADRRATRTERRARRAAERAASCNPGGNS